MGNLSAKASAALDRQIAEATKRAEAYRADGLFARSARYDRAGRRIMLELTSGYVLGVPIDTLPHLANATPAQLEQVELGGSSGMTIRIPALDADYSVPALVGALTSKVFARRGGQATSARKKQSSSANGKKGGRPRKTAAEPATAAKTAPKKRRLVSA